MCGERDGWGGGGGVRRVRRVERVFSLRRVRRFSPLSRLSSPGPLPAFFIRLSAAYPLRTMKRYCCFRVEFAPPFGSLQPNPSSAALPLSASPAPAFLLSAVGRWRRGLYRNVRDEGYGTRDAGVFTELEGRASLVTHASEPKSLPQPPHPLSTPAAPLVFSRRDGDGRGVSRGGGRLHGPPGQQGGARRGGGLRRGARWRWEEAAGAGDAGEVVVVGLMPGLLATLMDRLLAGRGGGGGGPDAGPARHTDGSLIGWQGRWWWWA